VFMLKICDKIRRLSVRGFIAFARYWIESARVRDLVEGCKEGDSCNGGDTCKV